MPFVFPACKFHGTLGENRQKGPGFTGGPFFGTGADWMDRHLFEILGEVGLHYNDRRHNAGSSK